MEPRKTKRQINADITWPRRGWANDDVKIDFYKHGALPELRTNEGTLAFPILLN